ncbi:hypothetical protein D3C77_515750 [compost metagenome]
MHIIDAEQRQGQHRQGFIRVLRPPQRFLLRLRQPPIDQVLQALQVGMAGQKVEAGEPVRVGGAILAHPAQRRRLVEGGVQAIVGQFLQLFQQAAHATRIAPQRGKGKRPVERLQTLAGVLVEPRRRHLAATRQALQDLLKRGGVGEAVRFSRYDERNRQQPDTQINCRTFFIQDIAPHSLGQLDGRALGRTREQQESSRSIGRQPSIQGRTPGD